MNFGGVQSGGRLDNFTPVWICDVTETVDIDGNITNVSVSSGAVYKVKKKEKRNVAVKSRNSSEDKLK